MDRSLARSTSTLDTIPDRVAQVQNVAQVALEAGNSPKMTFSNYRELVKPAQAAKWFAISPEQPANVIPVPKSEAAPVEVAAATAERPLRGAGAAAGGWTLAPLPQRLSAVRG